VDTGVLYRTVVLIATRLELTEESEIAEALLASDIQIVDGVVRLDGAPVGVAIRSPAMSRRASEVSAMPAVRAALLDVQRRVARSAAAGAVLEGRDIGTVVFPDADVKVFLTASAEERARRRTDELAASGRHVDYQVVLADIVERDARDTGRAVAPLKQAADAVAVDSTALGADAVVERIVSLVRDRLG
jgi:cytidylate kinase